MSSPPGGDLASRRGGADGAPVAEGAYLPDISSGGACVTFETDEPIIGATRDYYDVYVRAFTANCGDPVPAGGGTTGDPSVAARPRGTQSLRC